MQKRIENVKEYFVAFNIAENTAYAQLRFPTKWDVPSNEILEENFNTRSAIENDGSVYFFSDMSNGIMNVFDAVDFTIEYNKDLEEKSELFREKIEELKQIFATKTLEELRNLTISVKEVTTLPWKKSEKGDKKERKRGKDKPQIKEDEKVVNNEVSENEVAEKKECEEIPPKEACNVPEEENSLLAYAQGIVEK